MAKRQVDDPSAAAGATFNMTPMIDVTFQLIVVFLCSMKFRTLDQKLEAQMPTDIGIDPRHAPMPVETVLHVRLSRPGADAVTRVAMQGERLGSVGEGDALWSRLEAAIAGVRGKAPDLVGEIVADPEVEHGDVVRALDSFKGAGVGQVRFHGTSAPFRPPAVRRGQ